jgi:hypothetical protein
MKKSLSLFFGILLVLSTECNNNKPKLLISYKEYNNIISAMGLVEINSTIAPNSMMQLFKIKDFKTTLQSVSWVLSFGDTIEKEISYKMFPWSIDNAEKSGYNFEVVIESQVEENTHAFGNHEKYFDIFENWSIIKLGSLKDTTRLQVIGWIDLKAEKSMESYQSDFNNIRLSAINELASFIKKPKNPEKKTESIIHFN